MANNKQNSYFVVKSYSLQGLEKARLSCEWACTERKTGVQTWKTLRDRYSTGSVYLIFSVNNCHGYHGYATLTSAPSLETEEIALDHGSGTMQPEPSQWHRFSIKWEKLFLDEHGENCLPFTKTQHLKCLDGTPLNQARNFAEVAEGSGREVCSLMAEEYRRLGEVRERRQEEREARRPPPFLQVEAAGEDLWGPVLQQVAGLGTVVLACVYGSQRYNCNTQHSDTDVFIVYQAPTASLLGFNTPPATIKNKEKEKLDYTILELHRFCELLLLGDPRCLETLFLDESTIHSDSPIYRELCAWKTKLLSKQCVDKYLNDACGAKGMRLMDKWVQSGEAMKTPMPQKVGKLFYIIIRLLQNARDVVVAGTLEVYRRADSKERQILMQARACELTYTALRDTADSLEKEVRAKLLDFSTDLGKNTVTKEVEEWLVEKRYLNLQQQLS